MKNIKEQLIVKVFPRGYNLLIFTQILQKALIQQKFQVNNYVKQAHAYLFDTFVYYKSASHDIHRLF